MCERDIVEIVSEFAASGKRGGPRVTRALEFSDAAKDYEDAVDRWEYGLCPFAFAAPSAPTGSGRDRFVT